MDSKQIIDALTAHISLYHASIPSSNYHAKNSQPTVTSPRSSVLKWFSSLTVHHRLAALTTVDHSFVQVLIKMLNYLSRRGAGSFILLPDLPSEEDRLPSLCYRKVEGLLGRVRERDEAARVIWEGTRLFESREGEKVEECSGCVRRLDTVTFREEMVEDVERFVEVMDSVSDGGFLRDEVEGVLGGDWVEVSWLKGKGYYGIEAFVVNKMEVSLRLAWLGYCGGKRRGVKLKEKVDVVGVSANAYWRKKGFVDWWERLDVAIRRDMLIAILGENAKALIAELTTVEKVELEKALRGSKNKERCTYLKQCETRSSVVRNSEFSSLSSTQYSRSHSFGDFVKGLLLLQDIYTVSRCGDSDKEKLYFSKFDSVNSSLDSIFRKIRGLLMAVSLQSTRMELLDEVNKTDTQATKCKVKAVPGNRRKKGRPRDLKRPDLVSELQGDECKIDSCITKDDITRPLHSNKNLEESQSLTAKNQECTADYVSKSGSGKGKSSSRKSRKERKKNKNVSANDSKAVGNSPISMKSSSVKTDLQKISTETERLSNSSVVQNGNSDGDKATSNLTCHTVTNDSRMMKNSVGSSPTSIEYQQPAVIVAEGHSDSLNIQQSRCVTNHVDLPQKASLPEITCKISNGNSCFNNREETKARQGCKIIGSREEMIRKQQERGTFSDSGPTTSGSISYEWPSVPYSQTSVANSYLPAATDRLHLDAGHNWHTHFHRSFVPPMHQARNLSIQNGRNRIFPRAVPMSVDWPPVVRGFSRVAPSVACSYDSGFISRRQSFHRAFTSQHLPINHTSLEDPRKYAMELSELSSNPNVAADCDSIWLTEEELKMHAVPTYDYNQYFGGGVMYWNPSDYTGGVSRPPSLSSDDSSWAWHEAEMRQDVDDMVAFSSSYSTNGLTSPTAASFCSPFDPLGTGPHTIGYVIQGKDKTGKVIHSSPTSDANVEDKDNDSGSLVHLPDDSEGNSAELLPYPILPSIIIPSTSRERSRSELHGLDYKASSASRDPPQVARPPSPMVLCVSRAPRPPPPSSVSDSRRQKGFPSVRSGSSSPRNWSLRSIYSDVINVDDTYVCMDGQEVVWPWRNSSIAACTMAQPISGPLLQDRLIAISQLAREKEHPDVAFPLQPPERLHNSNYKASLDLMYTTLQDEIESFCQKVALKNMIRKPYISWAVKRVRRSLQVLWPRSRTNVFGSNATGLSLPSSDVDLVVSLPPVRNLEPIKEAGILEGRNGIKETCLQHAARYLANQEWVKNDSLKTVENTAIPIIMLVVDVPHDLVATLTSKVPTTKPESSDVAAEPEHIIPTESVCPKKSAVVGDSESVRLDISFKSPSHTGLQTTDLVKQLTEHFPAATPLALVLKQFLADRSLDQSYSGGLSSYCLIVIITRFLQHEHHLGHPINQNFGKLLMDFLYFFGNVFDPRQMRISVQGTGLYMKRERGHGSIDPIHIDDPLSPTNNVGRNCFRIHQCIKAFADAYSILEQELAHFKEENSSLRSLHRLLPKIIPSCDLV